MQWGSEYWFRPVFKRLKLVWIFNFWFISMIWRPKIFSNVHHLTLAHFMRHRSKTWPKVHKYVITGPLNSELVVNNCWRHFACSLLWKLVWSADYPVFEPPFEYGTKIGILILTILEYQIFYYHLPFEYRTSPVFGSCLYSNVC